MADQALSSWMQHADRLCAFRPARSHQPPDGADAARLSDPRAAYRARPRRTAGRVQAGHHARLEYAGRARLSAARSRRERIGATFSSPRPAQDRNSLNASNAISNRQAARAARAKAEAGRAEPGRPANGASSSSTDEWFRLTGPSVTLDPRIHAYRDDIADIALAGQVLAPHYARAAGARLRLARGDLARRPERGQRRDHRIAARRGIRRARICRRLGLGLRPRRSCHRLCRGDRARRPDRGDPYRLREMRAGGARRADHLDDHRPSADGRAAARP